MQKILEIFNNKRIYILLLCILGSFFCLRFINMERDLPSWGVALYTSIDEGTYSSMALNKYIYGEVCVENQKINTTTPPAQRTNVFGNILTYLSLEVFGRTYYGVRMPSGIWTTVSLLLVFFILNRILKDNKNRRSLILLAMFILCGSFVFLLMGRIAEPSAVRMTFGLLLCALFVSRLQPDIKMFLIGAVFAASIYFVYITNAFFVLPCMVALYFECRHSRKIRSVLVSFLFGILLICLIGEIYYVSFWGMSFFENSFNTITGFASVNDYANSKNIILYVKNFKYFFQSNIFLYNMPVFFLFLFMLPVACYGIFRFKDKNLSFLLIFPVAMLMQTIVSQDFIFRKSVVIYPQIIMISVLSLIYSASFVKRFYNSSIYLFNFSIKFNKFSYAFLLKSIIYFKQIIPYWILLCILIAFFTPSARLFFTASRMPYDFEISDQLLFVILQMLPVAALLIYALYRKPQRMSLKKYITFFLMITFSFSFIFNVFMSCKYVFFHPVYKDKLAMVEIGNKIGNNYLLGEWSYSFSLYNNIKPVDNKYSILAEYMSEHTKLKILLYGRYLIDDNLLYEFLKRDILLKQEFIIDKSYKTFGEKRYFAIYGAEHMTSYNDINLQKDDVFYKYFMTNLLYKDKIGSLAK